MPRGVRNVIAAISSVLLASAWLAGVMVRSGSDVRPAVQQVGTTPGAPEVPVTGFGAPSGGSVHGTDPARLTAASAVGHGAVKELSASKATSPSSIPPQAYLAYQRSAKILERVQPSCHLPWSLLAGIGRVESDHGQYGGSRLDSDGQARPAIIGIALDGTGQTAKVSDTDHGRWDHDRVWDRAVGPMQFIPSTWRVIAVDGNNDGHRNPQNIYDAALAAGVYLCADGHNLATPAGARAAVFSYNHSDAYVRQVLALATAYKHGKNVAPARSDFTPSPLKPGTPDEHARTTSKKVQADADKTPTPSDTGSDATQQDAKQIVQPRTPQQKVTAARKSQDQQNAAAAGKTEDQQKATSKKPTRQGSDEQMLAQGKTTPQTEQQIKNKSDSRQEPDQKKSKQSKQDKDAEHQDGTGTGDENQTDTKAAEESQDDTSAGNNNDGKPNQKDDDETQPPGSTPTPTPSPSPSQAPSASATPPSQGPVVCVRSQTQDGVLIGCTQDGEELQAPYACKDADTGAVMKLGEPEELSELPFCTYKDDSGE